MHLRTKADRLKEIKLTRVRIGILLAGFLGIACLAGNSLLSPRQAYPVSLAMTGYEAAPAGYDPQILFQLTNHTASEVRFEFIQHATHTSGYTANGAGIYDLPAHAAARLFVAVHQGTNGWRGDFVFTASRRRPAWQQRLDTWSTQIGLPSFFAGSEWKFPWRTNLWSTP